MAFKWINLTYDVLNKTANASAADFDVRPNKTVGVNFPFDAPFGRCHSQIELERSFSEVTTPTNP